MKRNDLFLLKQVNEEYYLISSGQAAADRRLILKTNPVGAFIWEALKDDICMEHLLKLAMHKYEPAKDEIEGMVKEIHDYVHLLFIRGLVTGLTEPEVSAPPLYTTIKIAGIKIKISGDGDILDPCLKSFKADFPEKETDLTVHFRIGLPAYTENGWVIVRKDEMQILENDEHYIIICSDLKQVKEIHISKNLKEVDVFAIAPYDDKLRKEFYLALRTPFLLKALNSGMLMLHSASLLYKGKVYCFSAPAGTGKTTHTSIWKRLFDCTDVNGDLNLLVPGETSVMVLGTPWCGTSRLYTTETLPLGGIIFLKRSGTDHAEKISFQDSFLKIVARTASPNWNTDLAVKITDLAETIAGKVDCYTLECTMNDSAAEEIKWLIDKNMK
ncbi:MAG: hypothetical protein K6A74_05500 [Lachnospiraceae bacterium]|nr:hypothetical protein [Lachnospiraceae bacterium]